MTHGFPRVNHAVTSGEGSKKWVYRCRGDWERAVGTFEGSRGMEREGHVRRVVARVEAPLAYISPVRRVINVSTFFAERLHEIKYVAIVTETW
jgi:hypothetical protein